MSKKVAKKIVTKAQLKKMIRECGPDEPLPIKVSEKGLRALAAFMARKK